ncbi:MAG: tetratricopeptide repeat protein, partial [Candidatus Gallimonas sp.]
MRQKKDEKIAKLDLNDEFLLESADRRFQTGDYMGALRMLNKRNRMYAPTCDSSVLAADIYEAMGLYPNAADAWFHFLDTCNEADFAEGYEGLAVAFMNMGNEAQSALYYQKMLAEDEEIPDESKAEIASRMEFLSLLPFSDKPRLRVVYSADGTDGTEAIRRGLEMLRTGKLKEAREALADVSDRSEDYPAAKGLSAMCALLEGDVETAERECRQLLERYPDNIQALTTYCAVLGEKGDREAAQRVARRLLEIPVTETDDLYKVASALCETGLDEPAFRTLSVLKERLPYDRTVLYFYSVAAYRSGAVEEAISALETLCTVYPRAAVAEYYLTRMRVSRDGGERVETRYFYRMPENEYETVVKFLSKVLEVSESGLERLAAISEPEEFFRLAFDENEGRDEK